MCNALGLHKLQCPQCKVDYFTQITLPEFISSYLLKRGANLTDEHRKQLYHWDSGLLTGNRLKELLARLDRTQYTPAHLVVSDKRTNAHHQSQKAHSYVQYKQAVEHHTLEPYPEPGR